MKNSLTSQTRQEAHDSVNSQNRIRVLGVILSSSLPLGASQVADALGWPVTSARPRLTELLKDGQIEANGKHLLPSGRHEATFSPIPKPTYDSEGQGMFSLSPSL